MVKKMSKIETAVNWMINTANDNRHGYDQKYRWGEKGDYDCSSAVITAWENAGVPVKTNGATYTGNMYSVFKKCGFIDVTNSVERSTSRGLCRGDVLLNRKHHTAMYIGNGQIVHASINEKGTAINGKPGDQTGKEFYIRTYYNFPWDYVLRFNETDSKKSESDVAREVIMGKWGNGSDRINRLRAAGYNPDNIQKIVNSILSAPTKIFTSKKSDSEIAKEVIRGKWGNGSDRIRRLRNAGFNPENIQKIVNTMI